MSRKDDVKKRAKERARECLQRGEPLYMTGNVVIGKRFEADCKGQEAILLHPLLLRSRQIREEKAIAFLCSRFMQGTITCLTRDNFQWIGYTDEMPPELETEIKKLNPISKGTFSYKIGEGIKGELADWNIKEID